jgi:hypothetical protein
MLLAYFQAGQGSPAVWRVSYTSSKTQLADHMLVCAAVWQSSVDGG